MADVQILTKGDAVRLQGSKAISVALLGLGWDPQAGQSRYQFDMDASAILRDAAGNAQDVCYYAKLQVGEFIAHQGDNLTGQGDGDDEQIVLKLSHVPPEVAQIDLIVNIYQATERGQNFGMVENAFVRVENNETHVEVLRYDLVSDATYTASMFHFGSFVRTGPTWTFVAVGQPRSERNLQEISNAVVVISPTTATA